jgi:hypothetical protein
MNSQIFNIDVISDLKYELMKIFPNTPLGIRGSPETGYYFSVYKDKSPEDPNTFEDIKLEYAGEIGPIYPA